MVPDLAGLVRELAEARIRYIVIGGIAVAAHAFVRATEDLDIVPDPTPTNLDELCNMLVRIKHVFSEIPAVRSIRRSAASSTAAGTSRSPRRSLTWTSSSACQACRRIPNSNATAGKLSSAGRSSECAPGLTWSR